MWLCLKCLKRRILSEHVRLRSSKIINAAAESQAEVDEDSQVPAQHLALSQGWKQTCLWKISKKKPPNDNQSGVILLVMCEERLQCYYQSYYFSHL